MHTKKAFTLIELMIVVAIIGILAAIAVPNFIKFQCRSKQSEAKGNLKALYVSQEAFRAENDTYSDITDIAADLTGGSAAARATASNAIGWVPKGSKLRYGYAVTSATSIAFSATASAAVGNVGDLRDEWGINEANVLANTTKACE